MTKHLPVIGQLFNIQYPSVKGQDKVTRQTLSKQIRIAVEKRLDGYDLLLTGNLADEIAGDIVAIIESRKREKHGTCPQEWMTSLYRLCGVNPTTATPGMRSQISECGQALVQANAEIGDLGAFATWWKEYTSNWSVTCRFPTPVQVRDNWGKFISEWATVPVEPTTAAQANANFSQRL